MATLLTAEQFVKKMEANPEALSFTTKHKNKQGKAQIVPYMEKDKKLFVQFGTKDDPLNSRGVMRFDNATKHFFSLDSTNPAWALADRSGFNNLLTKKLDTELTLSKYDQEGTSAYWAYRAMQLYVDRLVHVVAHGVKDAHGHVTPIFEDEVVSEQTVRHFLTLPYREPAKNTQAGGDAVWPPKLKPKVRIFVEDAQGKTLSAKATPTAQELNSIKLSIEPKIYDLDAGEAGAKEPSPNPIAVFTARSTGMWICEFVPVVFRSKSEINVVVELKKARLKQRVDVSDGLDFVDDDGNPAQSMGGFGSGGASDGASEPAAKRAKTENGAAAAQAAADEADLATAEAFIE